MTRSTRSATGLSHVLPRHGYLTLVPTRMRSTTSFAARLNRSR